MGSSKLKILAGTIGFYMGGLIAFALYPSLWSKAVVVLGFLSVLAPQVYWAWKAGS